MFGLSEDEEYVNETDTGGQDWQPTQIGERYKSHIHEAPDKEAENAHSRRLCREDQTAPYSASHAENIAHSQRLRREDQTARCSAAAIKKSSQVPRAASTPAPVPVPVPVPVPAPPIRSRVTRSQGKASAAALTASASDPFTYAEAMESPQRNHWKRAMEEESTSILLKTTFSPLNSRESRQLKVRPIGS